MIKNNLRKPLCIISLGLFMLAGILANGQKSNTKKGDGKVHLIITQEINGKSVSVDTMYSPDQQDEVMAYLKSRGFSITPAPPATPVPPVPPRPPVHSMPPVPPLPPAPPLPPTMHGHDIIIHMDDIMSDAEKKIFEHDMEKLNEALHDLEIPEIPDLKDLEFDIPEIHIEGSFWNKEDKEHFEKEMENLREEMKQLKKNLENIRFEIREEYEHDTGKKGGGDADEQKKDAEFNFSFLNDESGAVNKIYFSMNHTFAPSENEAPSEKNKMTDDLRLYASNFNIYPNPGDGKFRLDFDQPGQDVLQVRITDTTGKTVYQENEQLLNGKCDKEIDISQNGKGVYLLSLARGEQMMHKKIIVR